MFVLSGKYNTATVMTDTVEPTAVSQILSFLNHPAFQGTKIVVMPDVHAGSGSVVGFTSTTNEYVIPNVIGVDIGCGIDIYNIGPKEVDFKQLDRHIRSCIPSGFLLHERCPHTLGFSAIAGVYDVCDRLNLDSGRVFNSLGTLGGGNHFIELSRDSMDNVWVAVHSGSRKFGFDIANIYQKRASAYATLYHPSRELAWLRDSDKKLYLQDMQIAQDFARSNRKAILTTILQYFQESAIKEKYISSVHNYLDRGMIRKGAISAADGEKVVIPLNMRDGTIIGTGKGNADWNFSAPHGAGRLMSRGDAKKKLKLEDFRSAMKGVWTSCVEQATLDEAPMAYKDAAVITELIRDTVTIDAVLKPIYNFKAGA